MAWKYRKGFTIVELMVTVVVLIILTMLLVTRLVFTQMGGRDQERKTDVTTIATGLEVYYQNGSPDGAIPKGYYPGAAQMNAAATTSVPYQNFLDGVSKATIEAPGRTASTSLGYFAVTGTNPDGSYTDAQARSFLATYPYLYQPVQRNNANCVNYTNCVKFNLYYLEEQTNTVIKIRSKNQ